MSFYQNSHYPYLEKHLPAFLDKYATYGWKTYQGIIAADGDKGYGYQGQWEKAGIPFEKAMMVYLLSHCHPYSTQVRYTDKGWVDVAIWVIDNYPKFKNDLP